MKEEFKAYILMLINSIPQGVYEGMLSILCIGVVVFLAWKGKNAGRYIARLALLEYIFLIYCSTVICRVVKVSRKYNFTPFWSYEKPELFAENVMNVVVFMPIGLLSGFMFNGSWLKVKSTWLIVLMTGLILSVSIEALQYFFNRGFAETDDVIHNTLGCMIGYGIYAIGRYGCEKVSKLRA